VYALSRTNITLHILLGCAALDAVPLEACDALLIPHQFARLHWTCTSWCPSRPNRSCTLTGAPLRLGVSRGRCENTFLSCCAFHPLHGCASNSSERCGSPASAFATLQIQLVLHIASLALSLIMMKPDRFKLLRVRCGPLQQHACQTMTSSLKLGTCGRCCCGSHLIEHAVMLRSAYRNRGGVLPLAGCGNIQPISVLPAL
jgi:hypothetical protein